MFAHEIDLEIDTKLKLITSWSQLCRLQVELKSALGARTPERLEIAIGFNTFAVKFQLLTGFCCKVLFECIAANVKIFIRS